MFNVLERFVKKSSTLFISSTPSFKQLLRYELIISVKYPLKTFLKLLMELAMKYFNIFLIN